MEVRTQMKAKRFCVFKVLFATLMLADAEALAQLNADAFAYGTYLQKQEFEDHKRQVEAAIDPTEVFIDGAPYLRLASPHGNLYLPKTGDLTEGDVRRGLCGAAFSDGDLNAAAVALVDTEVLKKVKIYAALIVDTISLRCNSGDPKPESIPLNSSAEIGVKWQGSGRDPTTYSIFNSNLAPNIGMRADF